MVTADVAAPIPLTPGAHKPAFHLPSRRPATSNTHIKSPSNPEKHLVYNGLPKRRPMEELALPDVGMSPIAVVHMTYQVLSDKLWENCRFTSSRQPVNQEA